MASKHAPGAALAGQGGKTDAAAAASVKTGRWKAEAAAAATAKTWTIGADLSSRGSYGDRTQV